MVVLGTHINGYVGKQIKFIRKRKNFTQEQLGEKVGLPQPYIGGIERGGRNISLDTLERLLGALEVSPGDFFRNYNGNYSAVNEKAKETVMIELSALLSSRSVRDIEMIQDLAIKVFETIDARFQTKEFH